MDPIGMAFAKLRALLRPEPGRAREGLRRRVAAHLDQLLPAECANYIKAAGSVHSI